MDTSQNNEPHNPEKGGNTNPQNEENTNPQNEENTNPNTEDKPTIGLSILSFIIPIVGFILAAVKRKSNPLSAKRYLIFAIVSTVLFIYLHIIERIVSGWGLKIPYFIIPLIGFILAAVKRKSNPLSAKRYLIFAIVSTVLFIFLRIVSDGNLNLNMCMNYSGVTAGVYCEKSCFKDKNLEGCYEGMLFWQPIAEYLCESPSDEELTKRIQQYNSTAKDGKKISAEAACVFRDVFRERVAEDKKEIEEREKRERFKNSPRGRCERGCDDLYSQGTDTWRFCMMGCKDMKSY